MDKKDVFKSDFFEKLIIKLNAPKLQDKTNFFRLLAVSQKAGLGILESLTSLKVAEKNKGLRMIINDLIIQLSQGVSLADAMSNHDYFFSIDEIELVRSAQVAGNLIETLYDIAGQLEDHEMMRQKVKKALIYPIILIVVSIVAIILLLIFAIPNIVAMFPDNTLPGITVFMLKASNFFGKYGFLVVLLLFSVVFVHRFLYKTLLPFKIFVDKLKLSLPVVSGVLRTYYMYRFSKLLSQFYSAGISPTVSLGLIANVFENFEYKKKLIEIKNDLASGFTFFESMEGTKLFDPIFVEIMHVGEDTGTLTEVLTRISNFYKNQFQLKLDILMSYIEPLLMVIIAGFIGIIIAAVYLPMVQIIEVI